MARSRASAKQAGARFERQVSDYLRDALNIREIDRMVKTGRDDKGDIANVRDSQDRLVAIECKNVRQQALPQWTREAQQEATNYQAHVGVVVHKRHGSGQMGEQWVSMTLDDLVKLLS